MNEEQMKALAAIVAKAVTDALPAPKEEPKEEPKVETQKSEAPVFKGDATNPDDLKAYRAAVAKHELNEKAANGELSVDEIDELIEKAEAVVPSDDDLVEAGLVEKGQELTDKERKAYRELFEIQKSRNADEPVAKSASDSDTEEVAKSRTEFAKSVAGLYNESHGIGDVNKPQTFKMVAAS